MSRRRSARAQSPCVRVTCPTCSATMRGIDLAGGPPRSGWRHCRCGAVWVVTAVAGTPPVVKFLARQGG